MHLTLATLTSLLLTTALAATDTSCDGADAQYFALSIGGALFDANYLQSYRLSYANSTAWIGQIKYQAYSEPLIVSGAGVDGTQDGLTFLSIHAAPTGWQELYVVPHQTMPVGFSVPHGGAPANVRITGWAFGAQGGLTNNGRNLLYACQNTDMAAINSYQIWWLGSGFPTGMSCRGPLNISATDAAARF